MSSRRILLVEDEPGLVMTLTDLLLSDSYQVESCGDGITAVHKAVAGGFALIILDVMLPRKNGFDVCRDLRQQGCSTPILMLTARGQLVDKVVGLKLGADDYLTKPFEGMELLARMEALLRRTLAVVERPSDGATFGRVRVNFRNTEVTRNGEPIELSAREFGLLRYFLEHADETLSRERLLDEVWGYQAIPNTRTVDVHVALLRQKLEENPKEPRHIVTVRGLGYKFVPAG